MLNMESRHWEALYSMALTDLPQIKQDFVEWVESTYIVTAEFLATVDRVALWHAYKNSGELRTV